MQLDAKSTGLVLIDLQKGVLAMPVAPHPAMEVYQRSMQLAQRFRAPGAPVVRVRVSFSGDFADAHRPPVDQPTNFASLPPGWDEFPEPLPSSDLVITKRQWGAFYGRQRHGLGRNHPRHYLHLLTRCRVVQCCVGRYAARGRGPRLVDQPLRTHPRCYRRLWHYPRGRRSDDVARRGGGCGCTPGGLHAVLTSTAGGPCGCARGALLGRRSRPPSPMGRSG